MHNLGGNEAKSYTNKFLTRANTLEELAQKIKLPVDNLIHTVNKWNKYCDEGYDKDFGRKNIYHRDDMEKLKKVHFMQLSTIQ